MIDTRTHALKTIVPLPAEEPCAVAVSSNGVWIFVAALESGNRTEIRLTNEPSGESERNPLLWAWQVLEFVRGNFQAEDEVVQIDDPAYPDRDVSVIDSQAYAITEISRVGTLSYGLAADLDGGLWVAMTDHLNFKDGPEELDGHPILNRLVR